MESDRAAPAMPVNAETYNWARASFSSSGPSSPTYHVPPTPTSMAKFMGTAELQHAFLNESQNPAATEEGLVHEYKEQLGGMTREEQEDLKSTLRTHVAAGAPASPEGKSPRPAPQHSKPYLPLFCAVLAFVQTVWFIAGVTQFSWTAPKYNPWLGCDWEGLRHIGGSWPDDMIGGRHQCVYPIRALRLVRG